FVQSSGLKRGSRMPGKAATGGARRPRPHHKPRPSKANLQPAAIVAVGAAAGGLQQLQRLLEGLRPGHGPAGVGLPHLTRPAATPLLEALTRHSHMPVRLANDGGLAKPDTVYVLPPDSLLAISGGRFQVQPPAAPDEPRLPIDVFMRALAAD